MAGIPAPGVRPADDAVPAPTTASPGGALVHAPRHTAATELRTAAAGNPLHRTIAQLPGVAR